MRNPARSTSIWVPAVFGLFAVGLMPWTFLYISALPSRHVTRHWDVIWVVFDLAIALMLGTTALAARFGRTWLPTVAASAATLLLTDAWFDVGTAGPGRPLVLASLEAGLAELPLAALCIWVAVDATWATRGQLPPAA